MSGIATLPKAELHCHIEGAMAPALAHAIAGRNGITLPASLFTAQGGYAWRNFDEFLTAYDAAAGAMRTAEDYTELMYGYLAACAAEGAIYVEMFTSPDHAIAIGLGHAAQIAALAAGIDRAEAEFGIVSRLIPCCLRHLGPDRALDVARLVVAEPHPYVVGFGMAGDELMHVPADFAPAFRVADSAGLACTVHAGEVAGAHSVRDAIAALPVSRIGHGVRAIEDPALVGELTRRGIVLEVCPGSNLALGLYRDAVTHPLRRLLEAGCRVTLNSDDPAFFATSIGNEYAMAGTQMGLSASQLLAITRTAIDAAFVDDETRRALQARIERGS
ncbi:MAG: adenosine deaminase [Reyranellaceae bacterium]